MAQISLDRKVNQSLKSLPQTPGVYLYRNALGQVIYVGKAVNLRRRVSQYFQPRSQQIAKTLALTAQTTTLETISTVNEFDALLLEAKLINQYQPRYNSITKDDRSPLYLVITFKEPLPHLILARKTTIAINPGWQKLPNRIFGPFPTAKFLRQLLRSLRPIIPFCQARQRLGRPCFYTHLGLCDPCPCLISKITSSQRPSLTKLYRAHLFKLAQIFSGKSLTVLNEWRREMDRAARNQKFELAGKLRNQIANFEKVLTHHYEPNLYLEKDLLVSDVTLRESQNLLAILRPYYPDLTNLVRIECFDISNLSGQEATGSMVVLTEGRIDSSQYRKFKIKQRRTPNDVAMQQEMLERRFKHSEWPHPSLVVMDGGKPQARAAVQVLNQVHLQIPVIGLAKRFEEIIVPVGQKFTSMRLPLNSPALQILQRLRDEAHRFAITYHRLLRQKQFTPNAS